MLFINLLYILAFNYLFKPATLKEPSTSRHLTVIPGLTLDGVGGEECQVLGLQRVFGSELGAAALRLRLSGERRVVHLHVAGLDDAHVGRNPVSELDLDQVAQGELLGTHGRLGAVTDDQGILKNR